MKEENKRHSDLLAYLLGELPEKEAHLLEAELENDPQLRQQLEDIEDSLESMALENAVTPPPIVLDGLKDQLEKETDMKRAGHTTGERSYILPIAAGLAILFGLTSLWLYNSLNDARNQVQELSGRSQQLEERLNAVESEYVSTARRYEIINNSNVTPIVLEGNNKIPGSRAIAYLNHSEKEVWINPKGLPELEDDQTYQMWADVEGVMINMGVLSNKQDLLAMTYIDEAESLNITIEPAGGSDHPTVENLVANVYL